MRRLAGKLALEGDVALWLGAQGAGVTMAGIDRGGDGRGRQGVANGGDAFDSRRLPICVLGDQRPVEIVIWQAVLIPTALAPRVRSIRTSAGVSYDGPSIPA